MVLTSGERSIGYPLWNDLDQVLSESQSYPAGFAVELRLHGASEVETPVTANERAPKRRKGRACTLCNESRSALTQASFSSRTRAALPARSRR